MTKTSEPPDETPHPAAPIGRNWPVKTAQQLRVLIAVMRETGELICAGENFCSRDQPENDAREQAAKTYEMAAIRMRDILDDQTRWQAVDPADRLEDKIEEIDSAISQVRLQTLQQMQRPSIALQARVQFLPNLGKWAAWVGDLGTASLHGLGPTPEIAMAMFDEVYRNGFPQQPQKKPAPAGGKKNARKKE